MISPLRKANDTPISLATPWFQAHVSLANRKRRERIFESAVQTNMYEMHKATPVLLIHGCTFYECCAITIYMLL